MEHYKWNINKKCEYYPCHEGIKEENWSCLFCYCPLYLIEDCGGVYNFDHGFKDCSQCLIPHIRTNWGHITGKLKEHVFDPARIEHNKKENKK